MADDPDPKADRTTPDTRVFEVDNETWDWLQDQLAKPPNFSPKLAKLFGRRSILEGPVQLSDAQREVVDRMAETATRIPADPRRAL